MQVKNDQVAIATNKLPRTMWADATTINVLAAMGQPSLVAMVLQDGKLRTFSGTLQWDPSTGVGDGGLDTGSESADTWYYLYGVPDSGDDALINVRGSENDPDTGPVGFTKFEYLGCWRNDGSSNLIDGDWCGANFRYREEQQVYSNTAPPTSWTLLDLAAFVPRTAMHFMIDVYLEYTNTPAGIVNLYIRQYGYTNASRSFSWNIGVSRVLGGTLAVTAACDSQGRIDHYWDRNKTFDALTYELCHFQDRYLS